MTEQRPAEQTVLQSAANGDMRAVLVAVREWMDGSDNKDCPLPVELASAVRHVIHVPPPSYEQRSSNQCVHTWESFDDGQPVQCQRPFGHVGPHASSPDRPVREPAPFSN